jgi:carboxymethylenebutenolidase
MNKIILGLAAVGVLGIIVYSLSGTPNYHDITHKEFETYKQNLENMMSGLNYLRTLKNSNQKTACIGFCWGGGIVNDLAAKDPQLTLGVPYYGRQIDPALVPNIKAKLMLHYAGLDERINAGIPAYENALKNNQIDYQLFVYEGAQHAFNNDSSPARYQEATAKLAWERTMNFFKKYIKI